MLYHEEHNFLKRQELGAYSDYADKNMLKLELPQVEILNCYLL